METRARRGDSFLVTPWQRSRDRAFLAMGLTARGAYSTLWLALWDEPEPGVVDDDDLALAHLARTTPVEWQAVRSEVLAAFDTASRPGKLVLAWLVAAHAAQTERVQELSRKRSEAGRQGNEARWGARPEAPESQPVANDRKRVARRRTPSLVHGTGVHGTGNPSTPPPAAAAPPAGDLWIPVRDGTGGWTPDPEALRTWRALHPGLSIEREFVLARDWLASRKHRLKTTRGAREFMRGWLRRSEDRIGERASARSRARGDAAYLQANGGTENGEA